MSMQSRYDRGTYAGRPPRGGFTLTELLVVVAVIAILAGLSLGALNSARESAREARTRATIAKLNEIVMDTYENYRTYRAPIDTTSLSPLNAKRARLAAIRDIMRMEMPECELDVINGPRNSSTVAGSPVSIPWKLSSYSGPSLRTAYQRYAAARGGGTTRYNPAKMLYMMVSVAHPEAMGRFAENEMAVDDEDNWPMFIDAWGHPIMFIRWAPGFIPTNGVDTELQTGNATDDHDPFDPRKVDPNAFRLVPLIYSAGPDGEFDIELQAGYDQGAPYASSKGRPQTGTEGWYDNIHNHRIGGR